MDLVLHYLIKMIDSLDSSFWSTKSEILKENKITNVASFSEETEELIDVQNMRKNIIVLVKEC